MTMACAGRGAGRGARAIAASGIFHCARAAWAERASEATATASSTLFHSHHTNLKVACALRCNLPGARTAQPSLCFV